MTKEQWIKKGNYWKQKWTQFLPEYDSDENGINIYKFIEILNKHLGDNDVVCGDAGSVYSLPQSIQLKNGQRYIMDGAQMAMGAAIPMSIGISLARKNGKVIVCTGDGSFHSSIPALSTIRALNLPIVIFVWNNLGYLSINNTCDAFYDGRRYGTDSTNGLYFPKINTIAAAYDIHYSGPVNNIPFLDTKIEEILNLNEPIICEIICPPNQKIVPGLALKNGKSTTLDDMSPYLSSEEMESETIKD